MLEASDFSDLYNGAWSLSELRRLHKKAGSWIVEDEMMVLVGMARVLDVSREKA